MRLIEERQEVQSIDYQFPYLGKNESLSHVRIIDEVKGKLASYLYNKVLTYQSPIMLNGSKIGELTSTQKQELKENFNSGSPVVLIHANSNHVQDLHKILETDLSCPVKDFDIHAVRMDDMGALDVLNIHPVLNQIATQTIRGEESNPEDCWQDIDLHVETPQQIDKRVDSLLEWLHPQKSANRQMLSLAVQEEPEITKNLRELAQAYQQTDHFSFMGNSYQISTFVWSANAQKRDWFFFEQRCILNGSPAYTHDSAKKKGFYTLSYQFNGTPAQNSVTLEQARPETTLESRTATSGVSWNIGGDVGIKGNEETGEAGITLSGGATFSSQTTFEIPDVKIENNSANPNSNVFNLTYKITEPRWKGSAGAASSIGTTPTVARSTFQPINTWIWHAPESSRKPGGFVADFEFTPTLKQRYVTAARHAKTRKDTFHLQVSVAYPPEPKR